MTKILTDLARKSALSSVLILVATFQGLAQEPETPDVFFPPPSLEVSNVPEIPVEIALRLKQYREIGSTKFLDWAPNSKTLLVSSHFGETAQLQYLTGARDKPHQITKSPDPIENGIFRPGSVDILFSRDIEGTENFDLFFVDSKTSEVERVTGGGGRNIYPVFSKDGNWLAWSHANAGSADYSIVLAPMSDIAAQRVIYYGTGYWIPTDFSPDGKSLVLQNFRSRTDADLYVLDVGPGVLREIDIDEVPRGRSVAQFSSDGNIVYFLRDDETEYNNLYAYDMGSGQKKNLTADLNHEIDVFDLSPDGRLILLSCNEGGASQFRLIQTDAGNQSVRVPELDGGIINTMGFSPNSAKVAFSYSTSQTPENVFVFSVGNTRLRRWTRTDLNKLSRRDFAQPQAFTYPTFDMSGAQRRQITGYLYKPRGRGPHPVIVYLHGGPAWQFRPRFNSVFQYWVHDLGVAVIAPNIRGSTGYGRSFEQLDNGLKREDSIRDVGALLDWIAGQDELDASRVGVYGGSYGGYMSLASMMHFNDRLSGGVETSGISNLVTFLENTAIWRRDLRRREYGDERNPEMRAWLEARAPVNHSDKFTKPIFIIHGRNDTRVPVTEALQMYDGVRAQGGQPWLIIANDEGHGFRRKSNSDFTDAAVALFFQTLFHRGAKGGEAQE